jgi:glutamine---fructose-6-phosphate transaminase (isomerizing)
MMIETARFCVIILVLILRRSSPMETPGEYTLPEIYSQPEAWQAGFGQLKIEQSQIEEIFRRDYSEVIFTGCGSTYYTALAAASFYSSLTGKPSRGVPGSELWLNPEIYFTRPGKFLLVPISRSGETSETIQACRSFQAAGRGDILTLSCYPGMPLATLGNWNILLPSGQEESYAQTRAFTTLYIATMAISCFAAGQHDLFEQMMNGLPQACARLLDQFGDSVREIGGDLSIDRVYFLGSGLRHGLACELSMKMKEMSLTHCEPFQFLEFRHGPKTMASQGSLVMGLLSQTNAGLERAVATDVAGLGARTILVGEQSCDIAFKSGLPEALWGPLYLLPGQLLSYQRAIAKGLNPDRPFNLQPVIKLNS